MRLILFGGLLGLAVLASPARAQTAIEPGYWETVNRVISPFSTRKVERRCIRAADVERFMQGPSNHIYACTYPRRQIGAGAVRLSGSCATKRGPPVPVTGQGAYTRDKLHLEVRIVAAWGGLHIPIHAATDARRLSDECPVDSSR